MVVSSVMPVMGCREALCARLVEGCRCICVHASSSMYTGDKVDMQLVIAQLWL
jgi:hypothetical protein